MRGIVSRLPGLLRGGLNKAEPAALGAQYRFSRRSLASSLALAAVSLPARWDGNPDHFAISAPLWETKLWSGIACPFSLADTPKLVTETASELYSQARQFVVKRVNSEGGASVVYITAANIAVYLLWKGAPTNFMVRHFANSLESIRRGRVWTSFTSNFSHMSVFHLGANMYLLNRFGNDVAQVLGSQRFYLFYGTAGVASSLASLTFRRLTKSNVLSLGASGAVVSVLWLYACFFPDRRMAVLGTEQTVSMQELVLAYTVIDAAGLLGSLGKIDFAAHLGGAIFGNFWFYLVRDKLVREQEARRRSQGPKMFKGYVEAETRPGRRD